MIDPWFTRPLDRRTPAGGEIGCDGHYRRGGEFEPFYIPRPVMPQVDEADQSALFDFIKNGGVDVVELVVPVEQLFFHQRVDMKLVADLPPEAYNKPVLTSRDGFVLDGNHRAVAHKLRGDPVPCNQIEADFEDAMRLLFAFPKTYVYGDGQFHPITN
jgi:hypothetical protein